MKRLIVGLLLVIAPTVSADGDPEQRGERRDGCPAGIRSSHKSTNAEELGSAPELDSALTPTNFTLALQGAYFTPRETVPRSRLVTTIGAIHVNARLLDTGHKTVQVTGNLLSAVTHRWEETSPAIAATTETGNIVIAAGLRVNWLSSFNKTDGQTIAGTRSAAAFQLYTATPSNTDRPLYQKLAFYSLFDDHWFRPQQPIGFSLEYRSELVGCYAPFIHVRADVRREDAGDPQPEIQYVVPATIAAGLAVSDDSTLFVQYGFIHYSTQGIYNINAYQRVRIGLDTHWSTFHATATLDAFIGSYDGMFVGLWLTQDFGGGFFR